MIVLHAAFCEDSLLLWGESSAESTTVSRRRRKDPLAAWFDAGPARLAAAAAEWGAEFKISKRSMREGMAWLPSTENRPIPSSALLADEIPSADSPGLAPWIVTVVPLDMAQSLSLLAACAGKRMLTPGVIVGEDLAYWAAALRFAAGLVLRGQFLPGLKVENDRVTARWTLVFSGPDVGRMHALAQAMPAVARAVVLQAGQSAPQTPAQAVLGGFLATVMDGLIRSSVDLNRPGTMGSIHDRWMHALTTSDGAMPGKTAEMKALAAQAQQWQRPIRVSATAPFRLCFRLEEPEAEPGSGSEGWWIRYLLQGTRDPSLILPASEAWSVKPQLASVLGKDAVAVKEHLLVSLGQAAGICARIEASLKQRTSDGYRLDSTGAHEFLREKAPALEQSGFGVMLPAWWTRRGADVRIKARANVKSLALAGGAGLSLESIAEFDWEVALGDEKISRSELAALARLKAPLVRIRGQWVEVNAAEIQAALELMKKKASSSATLREVVQMALGAAVSAGSLELDRVTATGWVADLLAQLEGTAPFRELPPPDGLQGTLRPYQRRGYSWLQFLKRWGLGACLADDMGLGKTIQALALIQHDYSHNGRRPVLLICPTSVVGNWQKEAARFTPDLPVLVHHGVSRHRGAAFQEEASKHAVVLSSYSLLHRDLEVLQEVPWAGVILDEAQNIKNPETKQARAARSLRCDYRIDLTGTPVENNVGDLWSLRGSGRSSASRTGCRCVAKAPGKFPVLAGQ